MWWRSLGDRCCCEGRRSDCTRMSLGRLGSRISSQPIIRLPCFATWTSCQWRLYAFLLSTLRNLSLVQTPAKIVVSHGPPCPADQPLLLSRNRLLRHLDVQLLAGLSIETVRPTRISCFLKLSVHGRFGPVELKLSSSTALNRRRLAAG